jgi:2-phosphosulfolactate phosphatase
MIELFVVPAGIPKYLDRDRPVVIIDVFRASTSIAAALAAGAKEARFAGSMAEAARLKRQFKGRAIMAGERKGLRIPGYDLGNSPREMIPDVLAGRPVIFNSTNGTKLLKRFADFRHVAVGSPVTLTATVRFLTGYKQDPILCCAGREGFLSGEDTLAAGQIIARLDPAIPRDDAALAAERLAVGAGEAWRQWARDSFHGRYLVSLGFGEDLDFCLDVDRYDFVPVKAGRAVIRADRSR